MAHPADQRHHDRVDRPTRLTTSESSVLRHIPSRRSAPSPPILPAPAGGELPGIARRSNPPAPRGGTATVTSPYAAELTETAPASGSFMTSDR